MLRKRFEMEERCNIVQLLRRTPLTLNLSMNLQKHLVCTQRLTLTTIGS